MRGIIGCSAIPLRIAHTASTVVYVGLEEVNTQAHSVGTLNLAGTPVKCCYYCCALEKGISPEWIEERCLRNLLLRPSIWFGGSAQFSREILVITNGTLCLKKYTAEAIHPTVRSAACMRLGILLPSSCVIVLALLPPQANPASSLWQIKVLAPTT